MTILLDPSRPHGHIVPGLCCCNNAQDLSGLGEVEESGTEEGMERIRNRVTWSETGNQHRHYRRKRMSFVASFFSNAAVS